MENWQSILISPDSTVLDAVKTIDRNNPLLTAVVVDADRHLLGTVTDGDIRRGMLNHVPMDAEVTRIMHKTPIFVFDDTSKSELFNIFKKNPRCRVFPILDRQYRVIGIKTDQNSFSAEFENPVLIMAGGLGTRLRPLTEEKPKPLLTIGEKPILEIILENFMANGFRNFYISVNYKAEMIEEYFGDGSGKGASITYLRENKRLGTAGSLSLLESTPDLPIIVMNGDLLTKVNFQKLLEFHESNKFSATMCVREHNLEIPFGVARVNNGHLEALEEKPVNKMFVNAGIYALNPEILNMVPRNRFYDMPELFSALLEKEKNPGVFPIREYWLDIGRMSEYEKADKTYGEIFQKEDLSA